MAIIFELVVNFGSNDQGADAAVDAAVRFDHVEVRGVSLPLSNPVVTRFASPEKYIEFSVYVRGLGTPPAAREPAIDPRSVTGEEITQIGSSLYTLLGGLAGYRAAIVGWNPESLVEVHDLETDWRNGEPPDYDGLVLASDLCERWELEPKMAVFGDGYRWFPYSGSKNLWSSHQ
jgi:hypothetical protein